MAIIERKKRILLNEPHIATATGGVANFSTDLVAPLKSCKIEFLPVQSGSGDPSPSNIRPITGWTGVDVHRTGKNLFEFWANGYWSSASKVWTNSSAGAVSKPIHVKAGTVVTISQDNASASYQFHEWKKYVSQPNLYTSDDNLAFVTSGSGQGKTYTVQNDCFLTAFANIGSDSFNSRHVQLEIGSSSSQYEPYTSTIYPISWQSEAGTVYGGYVDLASGTLVRTWGSYTVSDSTVISTSATNPLTWLRINLDNSSNVAPAILPHTGYGGELSDKMPYTARRQENIFGAVVGTYDSGTFYNSIYIYNTNIACPSAATAQDCVNYIKSITPTFVYPIKNAETYQLTPQQIKTLRGTNNIWSNANGNTTVKYWKH